MVGKMSLEMKLWAQMFFEDGSVSQGKRINVIDLCDENKIRKIADDFLKDLNREDGYLLLWGAGYMRFLYYTTISSLRELWGSDF